MQTWEEVRKIFPRWPHPLWQYSRGIICAICEIPAEFSPDYSLRIVQGYEYEKICRMCYWSKHVWDRDGHLDDSIEENEMISNPPSTDGHGNQTLFRWIKNEEEE